MLHATTWESCPAELLLSAAAPEDTGKDARLLEQLKQQNRRGLERVMKRYTAYVGTIQGVQLAAEKPPRNHAH